MRKIREEKSFMFRRNTIRAGMFGVFGVLGIFAAGSLFPSLAIAALPVKTVVEPPTAASMGECISFPSLPQAFATELSLESRSAEIRFLPFDFSAAGGSSRHRGFIVQDVASCGIKGNCDSIAYVAIESSSNRSCYRPVLNFTGKWTGVEANRGRKRSLASVRVEARRFLWNEKEFRFVEEAKE